MRQEIASFIEKLKGERRLATLDEAATKQGIILPLLSRLGWDTSNVYQVVPEYSIGGKRVDYALRLVEKNKLFIEVKKPREDLENHQEQLLNYSFKEGVKLAVLTNGSTWWFYLPLREGSWGQRKFYTVDMVEQPADDVASKLVDLMSRANVESSKAVENAENLYRSQQKENIITKTLPKAWNKLILETDEGLMDLLSEATEKLCGYKAEAELVEGFLTRNEASFLLGRSEDKTVQEGPTKRRRRPDFVPGKGFTGKSVTGFTLRGEKYKVDNWRDLLTTLCDQLVERHKDDFEKVFSLRGRKRQYFSRNPNDLFLPRKLTKADIYLEVNHSAHRAVTICFDVIALLGYSNSDLAIHAE